MGRGGQGSKGREGPSWESTDTITSIGLKLSREGKARTEVRGVFPPRSVTT